MKKFMVVALIAAMTLTMGVASVADNIRQLGNFVMSEDDLEQGEETPIDSDFTLEQEVIVDYPAEENTPNQSSKVNPETGAGVPMDAVVLGAVAVTLAGALTLKK